MIFDYYVLIKKTTIISFFPDKDTNHDITETRRRQPLIIILIRQDRPGFWLNTIDCYLMNWLERMLINAIFQ